MVAELLGVIVINVIIYKCINEKLRGDKGKINSTNGVRCILGSDCDGLT